jgi:hypothetical protein
MGWTCLGWGERKGKAHRSLTWNFLKNGNFEIKEGKEGTIGTGVCGQPLGTCYWTDRLIRMVNWAGETIRRKKMDVCLWKRGGIYGFKSRSLKLPGRSKKSYFFLQNTVTRADWLPVSGLPDVLAPRLISAVGRCSGSPFLNAPPTPPRWYSWYSVYTLHNDAIPTSEII